MAGNKDIGLSINTPRDKTVHILGGSTESTEEATQKRLKSVRDKKKMVRTSIETEEDIHRRFRIYLANKGETFRGNITKHIMKCIKDID